MTLPVPPGIASLVQMHPTEDIALRILRDGLPELADDIYSLIPETLDVKHGVLIIVRRSAALGEWAGDPRFVDHAGLTVYVYAGGPDPDEAASLVSEACRVVLERARKEQVYFPDLGQVKKVTLTEEPTRRSDWMPSAGPVQYADLPHGWVRYESRYDLFIRRPRAS